MKKFISLIIIAVAGAVAAADLPASFQVTSGEVKIELAKKVFWNMNGIWYKGKQVCRRNAGFYGCVISFRGLGWVGTGHLENKIGETEINVEFFLDGKPWQPVAAPVECDSFEMRKSSLLHQVRVDYTLKLDGGVLREDIRLAAEKNSEFGVLYLFMHPWEPMFTEYNMARRDGGSDRGTFSDENKGKMIEVPEPAWGTYYAPLEQTGFVSVVRDTSAVPMKADSWLMWNRGSDRKLYYVVARNASVQAGSRFSYQMKTAFFSDGNREQAVETLVKSL